MGDYDHCAACGAPTSGSYRCPACTAKAESALVVDPLPPLGRPYRRPTNRDPLSAGVSALLLAEPTTDLGRWARRVALGVLAVPVVVIIVMVVRQMYWPDDAKALNQRQLAQITRQLSPYGQVSDLDCRGGRPGAEEGWYCTVTVGGRPTDISVDLDRQDDDALVQLPAVPVSRP